MPRTHIAIIGAPLDLGQDRRGVDMGPSAVRVANLNARVESLGYEVEDYGNIPVEQKEAGPSGDPGAKYLAQIAQACGILADRVGHAARSAGWQGFGARRPAACAPSCRERSCRSATGKSLRAPARGPGAD